MERNVVARQSARHAEMVCALRAKRRRQQRSRPGARAVTASGPSRRGMPCGQAVGSRVRLAMRAGHAEDPTASRAGRYGRRDKGRESWERKGRDSPRAIDDERCELLWHGDVSTRRGGVDNEVALARSRALCRTTSVLGERKRACGEEKRACVVLLVSWARLGPGASISWMWRFPGRHNVQLMADGWGWGRARRGPSVSRWHRAGAMRTTAGARAPYAWGEPGWLAYHRWTTPGEAGWAARGERGSWAAGARGGGSRGGLGFFLLFYSLSFSLFIFFSF